jgi:RimJ/RimL family protein N-acetyltransferase
MQSYKCLSKQVYELNEYSIVPIRYEDRISIMQWRNEQLYHLRQNTLLTVDDQNRYFETVIKALFDQDQPSQILFSYLKNGICIGYGGLVHISWKDKNSEISFVLNTSLEKDHFEDYWVIFLSLIEQVGFTELQLYKIYTYAFDLRPLLYNALARAGFKKEAVLTDHCRIGNDFVDILIHTKFNETLIAIKDKQVCLREAVMEDVELLYTWVTEKTVRENSIDQRLISWENHLSWFKNKMADTTSRIYILETTINQYPLGQIRIDLNDEFWSIDYSIDVRFRGTGLGREIIKQLIQKYPRYNYRAIVKNHNVASSKVFYSLGFTEMKSENLAFLIFNYNNLK